MTYNAVYKAQVTKAVKEVGDIPDLHADDIKILEKFMRLKDPMSFLKNHVVASGNNNNTPFLKDLIQKVKHIVDDRTTAQRNKTVKTHTLRKVCKNERGDKISCLAHSHPFFESADKRKELLNKIQDLEGRWKTASIQEYLKAWTDLFLVLEKELPNQYQKKTLKELYTKHVPANYKQKQREIDTPFLELYRDVFSRTRFTYLRDALLQLFRRATPEQRKQSCDFVVTLHEKFLYYYELFEGTDNELASSLKKDIDREFKELHCTT